MTKQHPNLRSDNLRIVQLPGNATCAIESGQISRASCCSKCGSARYVEAHHDDYSKPLDVRWLCRSCHRRAHAEQNAVYRILHDLPPAPKECAR